MPQPVAPRPTFAAAPGNLYQSALFMIGASASFALMMTMVRLVSAEVHPFVAAFLRNLLGLVFMSPWLMQAGLGALKTGRMKVHVLRSTFGLGAMLSLFTALSLLPVAQVTALTFTSPLFATVGAALVLGERVRLRRWTATAIGFIGTLIVLRPDPASLDHAALIALLSAAFMAAAMLSIKSLSRTEHPNAIVIIMGLLMTPASFIPAITVWTTPPLATWPWLLLMGIAATIGQILLTRAFADADASAVIPFDFFRLIFASFYGYAFFREIPDAWTWAGAAIIVSATVYIARREARLAKEAVARAAPAQEI